MPDEKKTRGQGTEKPPQKESLYVPPVKKITPPEQSKNPGRAANVLAVCAVGLLAAGVVGWVVSGDAILLALGVLLGLMPYLLSTGYRKEYQKRQKPKTPKKKK